MEQELKHVFGLHFSKQNFSLSHSAALSKDLPDALSFPEGTLRSTDVFLRAFLTLS